MEISSKQSNIQYRVRILSAIKDITIICNGWTTKRPSRAEYKTNRTEHTGSDLFSSENCNLLTREKSSYQYLDSRNSVLLSLLIYVDWPARNWWIEKSKMAGFGCRNNLYQSFNESEQQNFGTAYQMIVFSKYLKRSNLSYWCNTDDKYYWIN
jgi:hypothetical protein